MYWAQDRIGKIVTEGLITVAELREISAAIAQIYQWNQATY